MPSFDVVVGVIFWNDNWVRVLIIGNEIAETGGSAPGFAPAKSMSTNATDDTNDARSEEPARRYAELNIGDEEFVIYDRENHHAWVQSSMSLDVAELR